MVSWSQVISTSYMPRQHFRIRWSLALVSRALTLALCVMPCCANAVSCQTATTLDTASQDTALQNTASQTTASQNTAPQDTVSQDSSHEAVTLPPDRAADTAKSYYDLRDYKRALYHGLKYLDHLKAAPDSPAAPQTMYVILADCARHCGSNTQCSEFLARAKSAPLADADATLLERVTTLTTELAGEYRELSLEELGEAAAKALGDIGTLRVGVSKTAKGRHVEILLAQKIYKPVKSNSLSVVAFDRLITFDFSEEEGTLRLDNVSGLRAKIRIWFDVVASKLYKLDADTMAEVTGSKFGMTQSVSTKVSGSVFEPIAVVVSRVKETFESAPVKDPLIENATATDANIAPDKNNSEAGNADGQ